MRITAKHCFARMRFAMDLFRLRCRGLRSAAHFKYALPKHRSPANAQVGIWISASHMHLPTVKACLVLERTKYNI